MREVTSVETSFGKKDISRVRSSKKPGSEWEERTLKDTSSKLTGQKEVGNEVTLDLQSSFLGTQVLNSFMTSISNKSWRNHKTMVSEPSFSQEVTLQSLKFTPL